MAYSSVIAASLARGFIEADPVVVGLLLGALLIASAAFTVQRLRARSRR